MSDMGILRLTVGVESHTRRGEVIDLPETMVDTGSEYTWIPRSVLETLGVGVERVEHFVTADGRVIAREMGYAVVHAAGARTSDEVVFAEEGDLFLLGARTLEGFNVRHGPPGSGELTTPTGAALLRVLSKGAPPNEYIPRRSGYGAGTRDIHDQLNALRIIVGDATIDQHDHHHHHHEHVHTEHLHVLSADIDDMSPEELAGAAEVLRAEGALDVVLLHTTMKKGRLGTRVEALVQTSDLARLEEKIFLQFTTIGVKTFDVVRNALVRESRLVRFDGRDIRVKVATLPDGTQRAKPEFDDLRRVAEETARPLAEIRSEVMSALSENGLNASDTRGR
jgi:predicted aspartyl protease